MSSGLKIEIRSMVGAECRNKMKSRWGRRMFVKCLLARTELRSTMMCDYESIWSWMDSGWRWRDWCYPERIGWCKHRQTSRTFVIVRWELNHAGSRPQSSDNILRNLCGTEFDIRFDWDILKHLHQWSVVCAILWMHPHLQAPIRPWSTPIGSLPTASS